MHRRCPYFIASAWPADRNHELWAVLLISLLLFLPALADAQEPQIEEPATAAEQVEALLEELAEARERVAELRAGLEGKTGESLRLQIRQLQEEELRNGNIAHELAELVIEAVEEDEQLGRARQEVIDLMERGPEGIQRVLDERLALLEKRQRQRDEAPADKAVGLQDAVNLAGRALDDVYRFYARHVRLMRKLGLDDTAPRASLIEQLQKRADSLATLAKASRDESQSLSERLELNPEDSAAKTGLALSTVRQKTAVDALRRVVDVLQELEADTAEYQELLFAFTGDISEIGFDADVVSGLLVDWIEAARDWARTEGWSVVIRTALVLLIIFAAWVAARLTRKIVYKALSSTTASMSRLLQSMLAGVVGNIVLILGVLVALAQLGISIGPMLAGLGIAGFIVGFALQDTLSNFASGVMILIYKPFDEGDVIEAAGVNGKVQAMNLVSTTVLTFDNQTLILPNNKIWGDVIRNVTHQRNRRVDLEFRIGHEADLELADKLFHDAVASDDRVLDDPQPTIRLHTINDSAYVFIVRPWVRTRDYWPVYWDLTRDIQERLLASGLGTPRLQRDVYVHAADGDGAGGSTSL